MRALALPLALPSLPVGVALALVLVSALAAYHVSLQAMVHVWVTSATYAHGFLIAPIVVLLVHRLLPRLLSTPQALAPVALLPLLGAGLIWLVATLGSIDVLAQLSTVAIAVAACWFLAGSAWLRVAWFPAAFLFLAVPLGDGLTPILVDRTADFVVAAVRMTGVPVFREGTQFVIPGGTWSVVSGCSGIRYLMATLTVGALYAHLSYRALWKQGAFLLVALAVALVGNWLRAFGIVMIAYLSDMRLALGIDHYIYGWVFFGVLLFVLMTIGSTWADAPTPVASVADGRAHHAGVSLPALVAALGAVLVWPPMAAALVARDALPLAARALLPPVASGFTADEPPADAWRAAFAGGPQRAAGRWLRDGQAYDWQYAWYGLQRPGAELVQAGNELVHEKAPDWRVLTETHLATGEPRVPDVTETVLTARHGEAAMLVWQWCAIDGDTTASHRRAQWLAIRAQLRGRGNAGAVVLVSMPLPDREALPAARARLRAFVAAFAPQVHAQFAQATGR